MEEGERSMDNGNGVNAEAQRRRDAENGGQGDIKGHGDKERGTTDDGRPDACPEGRVGV